MSYIIEANIGLIFLYGMYLLLLNKENEFRKQRFALLSLVACALLFPLFSITSTGQTATLQPITLPEIVIERTTSSTNFIWIYFAIALAVAFPTLFGAIKLYRIAKEKGRYVGSYFIIESNRNFPSWSFFNFIYVGRANELSKEEKDLIIQHEMLHGRLLHSIDMLATTLLCIAFWFNPAVWLVRRNLAKIHEFEVDAIIAQQNGPADYSMLLAKTALSGNGFLLAHHFNQSFILKRINMINMIKNRISTWKVAGLGIAVVLYLVGVACNEPVAQKTTEERPASKLTLDESGEIFTVVDQTAVPKNGITEFYEEISHNLEYPEQARKMGLEGKVFIEFIVNKDGHLSDIKVLKGIGGGCDAAALKAVTETSFWNPGKKGGVAVRQRIVLPVTFKLG